jgi:hypothetical protein
MLTPRVAVVLLYSLLFVLPLAMVGKLQRTRQERIKSGSMCVLPNSPEPPTRISPGGEYNPDTLTIRVDKGDPIRWPHKQPVLINDLDLQTNHLVVLTSDGKRIQSFRFKFSEDDDARLCIYYSALSCRQLCKEGVKSSHSVKTTETQANSHKSNQSPAIWHPANTLDVAGFS